MNQSAIKKRSLLRRAFTLIAEITLVAVLLVLLIPLAAAGLLRYVDPPTSSIMIQRAVERTLDGKSPRHPRHDAVDGDQISVHLKRAAVASEDARFFEHNGFDYKQIAQALDDAERGKRLRGASTISQQTAKNLFLWEGRSFLRKGLELYLTVVLEFILPKERLLEIYLNIAEWGDGVFGAEAAARHHFNKSAQDLTRDEAARLAAILPNPREWKPNGRYASGRVGTIKARMNAVPVN